MSDDIIPLPEELTQTGVTVLQLLFTAQHSLEDLEKLEHAARALQNFSENISDNPAMDGLTTVCHYTPFDVFMPQNDHVIALAARRSDGSGTKLDPLTESVLQAVVREITEKHT